MRRQLIICPDDVDEGPAWELSIDDPPARSAAHSLNGQHTTELTELLSPGKTSHDKLQCPATDPGCRTPTSESRQSFVRRVFDRKTLKVSLSPPQGGRLSLDAAHHDSAEAAVQKRRSRRRPASIGGVEPGMEEFTVRLPAAQAAEDGIGPLPITGRDRSNSGHLIAVQTWNAKVDGGHLTAVNETSGSISPLRYVPIRQRLELAICIQSQQNSGTAALGTRFICSG